MRRHCESKTQTASQIWGLKLLILHALDAARTPPSFCHTGKFSVPRRLRQKMRLLYLNDYGNGEHAAGGPVGSGISPLLIVSSFAKCHRPAPPHNGDVI